MSKILIALIVYLFSNTVRAEITPYASVLLGLQHGHSFNQGTALTSSGKLQDTGLIEDYGSFIGFRGNEHIDHQIHLVWQLEQYFTIENSGLVTDKNTLANKDSFLGVISPFGSIRMGRLSTIPKSDMEYVDPWAHDGKGVNGLANFTRLDGRLNNAIKYETPGYFGTKLVVMYSPDEVRAVEGRPQDAVNAGLLYKDATYLVAYSYYRKNNTHGGFDADVWHRAEIAVDHQIWMLALGYQSVKGYTSALAYNPSAYKALTGNTLTDGNQRIEGTEYSATLNYTFQEKLTYRLSYSTAPDIKIDEQKILESGYQQVVVGATYLLSEKAKSFLNYGQVQWDGKYAGTSDKIHEKVLSLGLSLDI